MNSEIINDRVKLIYHRLVARRLTRNPELVERARKIVDELSAKPNPRTCFREWQVVLSRPVEQIGRFIVSRDQDATRLRISSPFPLLPELSVEDEQTRRRLWKKAKTFARSPTLSEPSAR